MNRSWRVAVSARGQWAGRTAAAVAAVLGLGVATVACGGGSSSSSSTTASTTGSTQASTLSASQWIGQVCGTLSSWKSDLQSKSNAFQAQANQFSDLQQAKSGLVSFLNDALTSTNNMISRLEAAGPAPTKDGQAVSQALIGGFQQIQVSFQQALTQAQALPTDNPQAFESQAKALSTSLDNAGTQASKNIESALSRYPTDNLDREFNNNPTCQSVK